MVLDAPAEGSTLRGGKGELVPEGMPEEQRVPEGP